MLREYDDFYSVHVYLRSNHISLVKTMSGIKMPTVSLNVIFKFQVLHVSTVAFASTLLVRIAAIARPVSGVDDARSTSTNASRIPAKMKELASMNGEDSDAFACLVRTVQSFLRT